METVGSLIDKLSINELKIYHMGEQLERDDVDAAFREDCGKRLEILRAQRSDLEGELQGMLDGVYAGKGAPRPFRQMKMYNEKRFRD